MSNGRGSGGRELFLNGGDGVEHDGGFFAEFGVEAGGGAVVAAVEFGEPLMIVE